MFRCFLDTFLLLLLRLRWEVKTGEVVAVLHSVPRNSHPHTGHIKWHKSSEFRHRVSGSQKAVGTWGTEGKDNRTNQRGVRRRWAVTKDGFRDPSPLLVFSLNLPVR